MSRTRTDDNIVGKASTHLVTNIYPSSSVAYENGLTGYAGSFRRMTDEVTVDWKELRRQGLLTVNPLSVDKIELSSSATPWSFGLITETRPDGSSPWTLAIEQKEEIVGDGLYLSTNGFHGSYPLLFKSRASGSAFRTAVSGLFNSTDIAGAKSRTLASAYDKANQTDMLALVTAAELGKTIETISRAASLTARLEDWAKAREVDLSISPGRWRKNVWKSFSRAWLEWRYGYRQIYFDIRSSINAINSVGRHNLVRATASEFLEWDHDVDTGWTYLWEFSDQRFRQRLRERSKVTSGIIVKPDLPTISFIDTLGLNRLLSTGWELVPFTFIIDWFVDAGTRLSALEAQTRLNVIASWTTVHRRLSNTVYRSITSTQTGSTTVRYTGSGSYSGSVTENIELIDRVKNPQLKLLPSIDLNINTQKALDAVAILTGLKARIQSRHLRF